MSDSLAQTSANTSRPFRPPRLTKYCTIAQLGHWSSSLCHQCIHIIDCLQQHSLPDHTATPKTYTKHRDHSHILDMLSPQTNRELSLRLSSTRTFNIQQRLHQHDTTTTISTPIHLLCKIHSIKPEFKLIHLPLPFVQSSVNNNNHYSQDRRIHILVPRHVFVASSHMKKGPFSAMVEAKVNSNFSFAQ